MTISIQKNGKRRATVTVDGRTYQATLTPGDPGWKVVTDSGIKFSRGGKVKGIAAIFTNVTVNGAPTRPARPSAPRAPRTPGVPRPKRTRMRGGPAFAAPAPTTRDLKLTVLAGVEDLFVVTLREKGVTQDARDAYAKVQKLKALALGPVATPAAQIEADSALRMAVVNLVKLAF